MSGTRQSISALMNEIDALIPAKIKAVAFGAGAEELCIQLKSLNRSEWYSAIEKHSTERAAEICYIYKDGDLLCRDGDFLWLFFWHEIDKALKLACCSPKPPRGRRPFLYAAEGAFVAEVNAIRVRRLGPEDQRHLLDPDRLEWSTPFFANCGGETEP